MIHNRMPTMVHRRLCFMCCCCVIPEHIQETWARSLCTLGGTLPAKFSFQLSRRGASCALDEASTAELRISPERHVCQPSPHHPHRRHREALPQVHSAACTGEAEEDSPCATGRGRHAHRGILAVPEEAYKALSALTKRRTELGLGFSWRR